MGEIEELVKRKEFLEQENKILKRKIIDLEHDVKFREKDILRYQEIFSKASKLLREKMFWSKFVR